MTSAQDFLIIYLNDHLAGATGGVDLARRLARAHRGRPEGVTLRRLADEIADDRETLLEIMASLGVPVRRAKVAAGWTMEKVGRLKLNGRLLDRSPLSDVVELEAMRLGVEGKSAGWRTLLARAVNDSRLDVDLLHRLLARADEQAATLEEMRVQAAGRVLAA